MSGPTTTAPSRARILDAALALMSEHGVAGTSMRMLAGECGLNVATLYHHFPSKADLLVAVLDDRAYEQQLATAEPPKEVTEAGDPRTRLHRLVRWLEWAVQQEDAVIRLLVGESLRGEPTAREAAHRLVEGIDDAVTRWLSTVVPELGDRTRPVAGLVRALVFALIVERVALGADDAASRSRVDDLVAVALP